VEQDLSLGELTWIDDVVPRSGAWNMAIDEALLCHAGATGKVFLRSYFWDGPWRSIGYFSPIADHADYLASGGRLVRRLTGGGVVQHGADFTYTLAVPSSHPLCAQTGAERYRQIHELVAKALRKSGLECSLEPVGTQGQGAGLSCFRHPVGWDLLDFNGQKIAGAGQRRRRDGLLHQGSIQAECGQGFALRLAEQFGAGSAVAMPAEIEARGRKLLEKYRQ